MYFAYEAYLQMVGFIHLVHTCPISIVYLVHGPWNPEWWIHSNILLQTANRQSPCVVLASTRRHKCVVTECLMWLWWMRSVQTQSIWALSGPPSQWGFSKGTVWEVRPVQGWKQGHWLYDKWHYNNELISVWMPLCICVLFPCHCLFNSETSL